MQRTNPAGLLVEAWHEDGMPTGTVENHVQARQNMQGGGACRRRAVELEVR